MISVEVLSDDSDVEEAVKAAVEVAMDTVNSKEVKYMRIHQ